VKLDKNLQMLLETLPESVHVVWIRGSSEFQLEPPSVADHPRQQGQSSIDVVDLDEMDEDMLFGSSNGTTVVRAVDGPLQRGRAVTSTLDESLRRGTRKRPITDRLAMNPLFAQPVKPVKRKKSSAWCSQAAPTARPASKEVVVLSEDGEAEVKAEVKAKVVDRRAAEEDAVLAEEQEGEERDAVLAEEREEEAMAAEPQPLTADEARVAAAAEGLELVSSSSNETGFKGVSKTGGKYEAKICVKGKKRYLGTFATPEEAALCYARRINYVAERAVAEPGKEDVLQAEEDSLKQMVEPPAEPSMMSEGAVCTAPGEHSDAQECVTASEAFDLGADLGCVHGLQTDGDGWIGSVVSVPNSFWPGFTTGRTPATVVAITREPITFADGGSSSAYIIEAEGHHYPIKADTLSKLPVCHERPSQQQRLSTNAPAIPAIPAIRSRIEVYWPSLHRWQPGRVEGFDWHHLVLYDDGECRWHTLHKNECSDACGTSTGTTHDAGGDEVYKWRTQSFYGCFCGQSHDELPEGSGVWVQCESCSRWCHGECAGVVSAAAAEALENFSCPVCLARKAAPAAKHQGVQLHLCSHEASGYKNVRAVPNRSTFYALGVRGSYLGSFPTAEAAAIAYAMHVEACSEKVGRMAHVAKPPAHTESPRQPPTEQVQPGRVLFWAQAPQVPVSRLDWATSQL
jgi:hypothetical protein